MDNNKNHLTILWITIHLQKLHLKAIPHRDLSLLFGKDILQRYSTTKTRFLKLQDSSLFMCVAGEWI